MSNISYNRIDLTLSENELNILKNHLQAIQQLLPAIGLTPKERKQMHAANVNNKVFIEDVIINLHASGENIVPNYIKVEAIENDLQLLEQIADLQLSVNKIARILSDIKRVVAHEAYGDGLTVYKHYEAAAKAGIPGSKTGYNHLKVRFLKSNKGRDLDDTP